MLRHILRRQINRLGYDIHQDLQDDSPLFDPHFASIRTVEHKSLLTQFFVADRRDAVQSYHDRGLFYEQDVLDIMRQYFIRDSCFVDIGANVGNHCIFAAKHLSPSKVIAFEPMKYQHAILTFNVLLNRLEDLIEVHKIGASNTDGMARMLTPNPMNVGRSMIADAGYGEWVRLTKADAVLTGQTVQFIKIDVEGHEMQTLEGLRDTISTSRPNMLIEVDDQNFETFEFWCKNNGYDIEHRVRHHDTNTEALIVPT